MPTEATTPASGDTPDPGLHNDPSTTAADHQDTPDPAAELERWKSTSRKWEDRAKANAKAAQELDQLRAQSMTEVERAVNEAKNQTRAEVLREIGATRVEDRVRVAAAGRPVDIDALLEGLDTSRFLDDDHQPDVKAIQAWIDRIAPAPNAPEQRQPRVPGGPRGSGKPEGDPAQDFATFINGQLNRR